jgi:CspA family cold shock protein
MTCFLKDGPLPKRHGEVKWFNPRKRFGFIIAEDGRDFFVHQRQILEYNSQRLPEGQPVQFHARRSAKGWEALNVEVV